ncbi:MAG: hypothetical protein PF542_05195 [Nanoarchaeota archaeon]|jgi:predicted protein tyrosine phosphatase|nr:hypothetical protein [Nanoarchaeota archaeon]
MEFEHKAALFEKFDWAREKDVVVLDVGNDYMRFDVELERVLREKLSGMGLL